MLIVPTIHPAALLRGRDEESGVAKFEQTVIEDFAKAIRLTCERPRWDERVIWERDSVGRLKNLFPTPEEVIAFCKAVRGTEISTDTETTGEQVMMAELMCAGFASSNGQAMCVPFLKRGGSKYWSPHDEWRVKAAVGELLADVGTPKIIHNKPFDTVVYWLNGMPVYGPIFDCYVESETEFLTETGWKRYDQISSTERLATVAKDGTLEWQYPFDRVSKQYTGDIYTFETPHSRSVVTANHRMHVRPFYRQRTEKVGEWEFRRADECVGKKPDQFDVRVAFEDTKTEPPLGYDFDDSGPTLIEYDEDFMTLLGLWATDGSLQWREGRPIQVVWSQASDGQAISELRRLKCVMNARGLKINETSARRRTCTEVTFSLWNPNLARNLMAGWGRYSKNRRMPKFTLTLPKALRVALLKGLMLGDSGIVAGRHIFRTASKGLAGDVQALALSVGYAATIHWAGDCWGVTLWQKKLDRIGGWLKRGGRTGNITKRKRTTRIVCFSVPNETLVTRSRGKPAFHGNTMQAHHVIDSELPHALGYCMTRYLDARFHKDDVKGAEGWLFLDDTQLRSYNLRDCIGTRELKPVFASELARLGQKSVDLFHHEMDVTTMMARATIRGLAVDFWRRDVEQAVIPVKDKKGNVTGYQKGVGPRLRDQMWAALGVLRQLAGRADFDPMKPTQLKELLFDRLRLPVVKMTENGNHPSTDKEAMVLLALAADTKEQKVGIKALADFKRAQKFLSTFVEGLKVTGDGRLHPTWKLLTTSGRMNTSPNAQNWDKLVKSLFCAGNPRFGPDAVSDEDFVGVDLSQAEMRGIAYDANDARLLQMYAQNLNVHTVNLAMSLKVRPPIGHKDLDPATQAYIAQMMPVILGGQWTFEQLIEMDGNALKGARTLIKNDGFGRNYGAEEEIVFSTLRAKRDPDTNELLFPGLKRSEVEANGIMWKKLNVGIMKWWGTLQAKVKAQGYYECPISGRRRWFRGGYKKNDILGTPIQMMIASFMNQRMLEIQGIFDAETGGQALVVQQVHDALNAACPKSYSKRAAEVMKNVFARPIALPGHPNATFPADDAAIGQYLSEV